MYRNFSIIASLLFALTAGLLFLLQKNEAERIDAAFSDVQKHETVLLDKFVKQEELRLVSFANEYSYGDTAVTYLSHAASRNWDPEHLAPDLPLYDVDGVLLLDENYTQVACIKSAAWPDVPTVLNACAFIRKELNDSLRASVFGHFYTVSSSSVVWEIAYAPIQPSSDSRRVTAPKGYIVVLRQWNSALCQILSERARTDFLVLSAQEHTPLVRATWTDGSYRVEHAFSNRNGDNIAFLQQTVVLPAMADVGRFYSNGMVTVFAALVLLYLAVLIVGYFLVGRRIAVLTKVLKIGDVSLVEKAKAKDGEYGMLASAVEFAYTQRNSQQTASMGVETTGGRLAQSDKFLRTILRNLNGAVLVVSQEGILTLAEGRDLDSYGIMKDRDVNRPIANVLRGQDRLVQFETALHGKRSSMEQRVGERVFLTMCEPLLSKSGQAESIVVLALDVSEKRMVEETLTKAKQEAERANRVKTQFLSVMSHETRTPLNGVLGFASVLKETPLNEEQRSYLDRIVESGQKLLSMLSDIMDLARLEAGEGKKNMEPVSLQAIVYQLAERYRIACKAKPKLDFDLDVDQRLPDMIESDNEMLTRILTSILDNAVKFTDTGKVKFSISWVAKDKEGKSGVLFSITDTGPGIPPEIARNIFDPFHQGDSSNTREHGGLGLGLTIANRLVSILEGRLTFETKVDMGTTFLFFLPTRAISDTMARTSTQMRD